MKFARVYETLKLLEKEQKLTIKDALDVFYDLYEDVKDTEGDVLENQPIGDVDEFTGRLCWMARTTGRLYAKNSAELAAAGATGRWEKASEKLSAAGRDLEELEKNAAALRSMKQKLDATLKVWEARKDEVASMENAIAEQKRLVEHFEKLQQQCDIVREETERKRAQEFPRIQAQIDQADADMAKVQQMIDAENVKLNEALQKKAGKEALLRDARQKEKDALDEADRIQNQVDQSKNNYLKAMEQKKVQEEELRQMQNLAYAKWQEVEAGAQKLLDKKKGEKDELERRKAEALKKVEEMEQEIRQIQGSVADSQAKEKETRARLEEVQNRSKQYLRGAAETASTLRKLIDATAKDPVLDGSWGVNPAMAAQLEEKLKAGQQRLTQELENQKNLYRQLLKVLES